ncbi:dTDP-4-dehydrorhamnose 3,5-epimerase family protein [Streptomyces sp. NPDC007991]|uniref:dTDP-4-dehydrorhamnose 3,5-epimerase family protein n=1 Tax=Streptomyces sp. NPDC007991 TaxID=3364803 RepID=UPI0036ED24E9
MKARELSVAGVVEFTPEVYRDQRGSFVSPFEESTFTQAVGHKFFPVAQMSHSRSRRGTLRGIHYTRTPPGMAKYVYCLSGRALDIVVDLRLGSPTFGRCDTSELGGDSCRAVYVPAGVGHAFVALQDDTLMSYLMSGGYDPGRELALAALDPALALPVPRGLPLLLSDRDRAAPTLAEARSRGDLPGYRASIEAMEALCG